MADPTATDPTWSSWSGLESARPSRTETPRTTGEVVLAVHRAREQGATLKTVGTGHS